MKVLHIVESLHRGSVERWLLRTYLHAARIGLPFQWTFYCYLQDRGEMEKAAEDAGVRIVHSPVPLVEKTRFLLALREEIKRGDYDIVHSHHDLLSAFYYFASLGCGLRRITHVHNTDEVLPTASRIRRALMLEPMRQICLSRSDQILATSDHALRMFLAGCEPDPKRHRVHYCSIEMDGICSLPSDREGVRAELQFEPDAKILLFVGNMIDLKNPLFLVEMLTHLLADDSRFAAIFAGAGPEEERVAKRAKEMGIDHRVRVLGWREDVRRLMAASDLFVNPRREQPPEGLGLVNVEAQAAGLPALVSDGISPEPLLEGTSHTRIPLALGPAVWAKAALDLLTMPTLAPEATEQILLKSPFNPDFAVRDLHNIYSSLMRA